MSTCLNKTELLGIVGRDPTITKFKSGDEQASFSLATNEAYKCKESGEYKQKTTWHNIVVRNKHFIETVKKNIHKGSRIFIEGKTDNRSYTDKNGIDRTITEVIVPSFGGNIIIFRKDERNTESQGDANESHIPSDNEIQILTGDQIIDDIPF